MAIVAMRHEAGSLPGFAERSMRTGQQPMGEFPGPLHLAFIAIDR
jgi:hypothetical protein